jgi:hypothetical protein
LLLIIVVDIFCYPTISKSPSTTSISLEKFFNDLEGKFPNHELIRFMHMDKGTDFKEILDDKK